MLQAEQAVESCCLGVRKEGVTTFCRLITAKTIDERLLQLRRTCVARSSSAAVSGGADGAPADGPPQVPAAPLDLLKQAVQAELQLHGCAEGASRQGSGELPPAPARIGSEPPGL
jgi:hypothetical protein